MKKITRRHFLWSMLSTAAAMAFHASPSKAALLGLSGVSLVIPPLHRVVHSYHPQAVNWNYVDSTDNWYGDSVNQLVVDRMTDQGVMSLTGTNSLNSAWQAVIPNYQIGEKIAIKVNFNNAYCSISDNIIDALPQPVISVIRGLKSIGVQESAIFIYDVTNGWHSGEIPLRFINKIKAFFPNVNFHAHVNSCASGTGFSSIEKIHFNVPANRSIPDLQICETLVNAKYLINMPIMKKHGMSGVTLGFKNHFGSFNQCDLAHWSIELSDSLYLSTYNAMVDMMKNPHFASKTVLTVGDGLYGAKINNYNEVPGRWASFGNHSPCSLFFSRDPVAIDCVMYDFLHNEGGVPSRSDDYLKIAAQQGLGKFEHWDAFKQYHLIDYRYLNLMQMNNISIPIIRR